MGIIDRQLRRNIWEWIYDKQWELLLHTLSKHLRYKKGPKLIVASESGAMALVLWMHQLPAFTLLASMNGVEPQHLAYFCSLSHVSRTSCHAVISYTFGNALFFGRKTILLLLLPHLNNAIYLLWDGIHFLVYFGMFFPSKNSGWNRGLGWDATGKTCQL